MPKTKKRQYNIHEAKTQLSRILEEVTVGGTVYIARNGKTIARIEAVKGEKKRRKPDFFKGKGEITRDFFSPLDKKELKDWGL